MYVVGASLEEGLRVKVGRAIVGAGGVALGGRKQGPNKLSNQWGRSIAARLWAVSEATETEEPATDDYELLEPPRTCIG